MFFALHTLIKYFQHLCGRLCEPQCEGGVVALAQVPITHLQTLFVQSTEILYTFDVYGLVTLCIGREEALELARHCEASRFDLI